MSASLPIERVVFFFGDSDHPRPVTREDEVIPTPITQGLPEAFVRMLFAVFHKTRERLRITRHAFTSMLMIDDHT